MFKTYEALMSFTLPWAIENSDLTEDEVQDYIHDFIIDLRSNSRYDLDLMGCMDPTKLTKFFFQFVTRSKYIEGRWIDRRYLGRRTQIELRENKDLSGVYHPMESYNDYSNLHVQRFIESLTEDEVVVLKCKVHGDTIKSTRVRSSNFAQTLKTVQRKVEQHFETSGYQTLE
jgi:small nuclear ribonucleoprotein (snRNP)-like protein